MYNDLKLRHATSEDTDNIAELERLCFPPAEAATRDRFEERIKVYGDHFLLAEDKDKNIVGLINGPVTNDADLEDEMYESAACHVPDGPWQMIFGVETHPDHQSKGIASFIMKEYIKQAQEDGRKGVVLTCKKELIGFYERFGYVCEGVSKSVHGDAVWYQMRLSF